MFIFYKTPRESRPPLETELLPALKAGRQDKLRDYFEKHAGHAHCPEDLGFGFVKLFCDGDGLARPDELLNTLLEQPFSTADVFRNLEKNGPGRLDIETALWLGSATDPRPETFRAHAAALAEYIRYRLAGNSSYRAPLKDMFDKADRYALSKGEPEYALRNRAKRVFETTQAHLVDHIASDGPVLPLNRGAAILEQAHKIGGVDDSRLWSEKISRIEKIQGGYALHYD